MINGLYSGATALDVFGRQQELISSNLAHLNTPGHKRMLFSFMEKSESVNGESTSRPGTSVEGFSTDFSQGHLKATGRPLDVAISGDGFFEFERTEGSVYSRGGPLFRDPTGKLVNAEGMAILSDGNSITIPPEISDRDIVIDISEPFLPTEKSLASSQLPISMTISFWHPTLKLFSDKPTHIS